MDADNPKLIVPGGEHLGQPPIIVTAELVPEPRQEGMPVAPTRRRRVWLPLLLFFATWLSVIYVGGGTGEVERAIRNWGWGAGLLTWITEGLKYALPLMTILICHEMGHFVQAWRYGVYASYPYFIPMPAPPLGTFGAVIAMEPRVGHRRALFDIGITGPLAGLVPTIVFLLLGLRWSHVGPASPDGFHFGEPLLVKMIVHWHFGALPAGLDVWLHPMAFAGWVGLLVTSLNLIPIGQLDGGHILYALLREKARAVATLLLMAAIVIVIVQWKYLYSWTLILFLLLLMGPIHPPTANDEEPLGAFRTVLGWLTLAFIPLGFTPTPLQ